MKLRIADCGLRIGGSDVSISRHSAFRVPRSGFGHTLIELVLSMAVLTILMVATGSAVVLASRALPDAENPLSNVVKSVELADLLAAELSCARSVTQRSSVTVEFTVADRDADSVDETIRYEWSGTSGDPLTRSYNGGTAVDLAKHVQQFDLQFNTDVETTTKIVTDQLLIDDVLFATFDGWNGVTPSVRNYTLSATAWCSERFVIDQLTLPAGATDVQITHVQVYLKTAGGGPSTTLGIHQPLSSGNAQPAATPLGTPATYSTSLLNTTYSWRDFYFSDVAITGLANEFVLVVKGTNPSSANVKHFYSLLAPADAQVMKMTSNSGSSWTPASNLNQQDMNFRVYGSYKTTETSEETTSSYWLRSIGIAVQVGSDASSIVQTEAQVLNRPEVTGS